MKEIISFVTTNKEFFVIFISFLTIALPFIQYLKTKSEEQRQKNQDNFYERMMKKLTNQKGEVGLEEQVAVIFDLRNYPQYCSVSKRILEDCRKRWGKEQETRPHFISLINEANETLAYLHRNFLQKLFLDLRDKYF